MATWKKVIVSGSVADLLAVSASSFYVQDGQLLTAPGSTILSGSFSGSFEGSGAGITGITLDNQLTNSTGISSLTYDGSGAATVAVSGASGLTSDVISKWTGDAFADSSLTDNGTTITGATSIQLTGASSNLSGSFSGSFEGDGSNLTGLVTELNISGSDGTGGTVDLLTQTLTVTGVANEVDTSISGQTLTIGLPDSVTITSDLTVGGNLAVNGDLTYMNITNLLIEDKFILLNSGSAAPNEGGIIVDTGGFSGSAFIYEADAGIARWGFNSSVAYNATTANTTAYASAVVDLNNGGHSDSAEYQKNGNIKIDTNGDIYIYS